MPFFNNSNHYSIEAKSSPGYEDRYRFEAEIFPAIINDTQYLGQEYLVSIPKGNDKYFELFIFDTGNTIKQRKASEILQKEMDNFRGSVSKLISESKIYYLFAYRTSDGLTLRRFCFKNLEFQIDEPNEKSVTQAGNIGGQVSCFVIEESKYTICAYIASQTYSGMNSVYYFCQIAIDKDLNIKNYTMYSGSTTYNPYYAYNTNNAYSAYSDQNSFIKAIHLKEDIGVFIFWSLALT